MVHRFATSGVALCLSAIAPLCLRGYTRPGRGRAGGTAARGRWVPGTLRRLRRDPAGPCGSLACGAAAEGGSEPASSSPVHCAPPAAILYIATVAGAGRHLVYSNGCHGPPPCRGSGAASRQKAPSAGAGSPRSAPSPPYRTARELGERARG